MKSLLVLLVFSLGYVRVSSQQQCEGMETCRQCYAVPGCAWCSSSDAVISLRSRCFSPDNPTAATCPEESIQNVRSSVNLDELELTADNQISISKATLKLRAGDTQSFQFNVRAAENFPLDLYMIVDLSFSLLDDLTVIKMISNDIADAIQNISTRFQIGFGTFVDKLDYPYISPFSFTFPFTVPEPAMPQTPPKLSGPSACSIMDVCIPPFSYVHNVDLTNVSSLFTSGFDDLIISTNADNPEGTFDAMAQAVLCPKVVGWRSNSRKILVVITDATIHMAGDGIFAGITRPFPMECKTEYDPGTGFYTYVDNLEYDYPSLEQVRQIFEANLVSPVFAVLETIREYYDRLSEVMASSGAQAVTIQNGASDLIEALQSAYENIVSTVGLSFDVGGADVTISHSVLCPNGTVAEPDGVSCSSVVTNQTITFTVNVTLNNCTEEFISRSRTINVNIPGYGRFEVEVQGVCRCDCESDGVPKSPMCSSNGTLACGICDCDEGWSGDVCNCRTEEIESLICPFGANGLECSDRGDCLCGECECRDADMINIRVEEGVTFYDVMDRELEGRETTLIEVPRFYGSACECHNFLCNTNPASGVVCSGDQGNCSCDGNCECSNIEYGNLPYSGVACECNRAFCYDQSIPFSENAEVCNGNGECDECNPDTPCNCNPGFVAPFCTQSALGLRQCLSSGAASTCVECLGTNEDYRTACSSCNTSNTVYTKIGSGEELLDLDGSQNGTTIACSYLTADPICTYNYYVAQGIDSTSTREIQLVAVEPRSDCFPLRWWHLALILLGSLIILGIIILVIVKIIFMILDYKEVKHLDKSVAETDLSKNFNPLYQSPEVEYKNVAFGKE